MGTGQQVPDQQKGQKTVKVIKQSMIGEKTAPKDVIVIDYPVA